MERKTSHPMPAVPGTPSPALPGGEGGKIARKMKILHVASTTVGGVGLNILLLAKHLDRDLFETSVASPPGSLRESEFLQAGARLYPICMDRRPFHPGNLPGFLQLLNLLARERFDIVHTHTSVGGVLGRIAAKRRNIPAVLWTIHGWAFNYPSGRLRRWACKKLEQSMDRLTDRYVAVSRNMAEVGIRAGVTVPGKITSILHGIETPHLESGFSPGRLKKEVHGEADVPQVGFVGRIERQKAADIFLRAARLVKDGFPRVKFLIVGDGPLLPDLKALAGKLALVEDVAFVGWQRDPVKYLAAMDILCMPSLWESFGILLLEAMALQKPVVSTLVGGIPEVVVHGETGLLVPPSRPDELAAALLRLLGDRKMAEGMGTAGYARYQREFTVERMIPAYEKLYLAMARKGSGA